MQHALQREKAAVGAWGAAHRILGPAAGAAAEPEPVAPLSIPKQLFALPGDVRISAGFAWKAGADKGLFRGEEEQSDTAPTQQPALSRLSLPPIWVPKRLALAQAHKKGFPASTCMSLTFCAWAFARFFSLGEHDPSQSHLRYCQRAPIGMRQKGFPLFAGATLTATPSQGGRGDPRDAPGPWT